MTIERIISPPVGTNAYLLKKDGESLVVDPSGPWEFIKKALEGTTLKGVLLTHGHIDHISALKELHEEYPLCPLFIHKEEEIYFKDARFNLSLHLGLGEQTFPYSFTYLSDGEEISLLGESFKALHAPGHTLGSLCYYDAKEGILFSGDVLFASSIGRSDLPGGDPAILLTSLQKLITSLPKDTVIYPGHGESSTIEREKRENPFIK